MIGLTSGGGRIEFFWLDLFNPTQEGSGRSSITHILLISFLLNGRQQEKNDVLLATIKNV